MSMASWFSTSDRPTAGSMAGGGLAEDRGFFPFFVRFGAMAMERAELGSDGEKKLRFEEAEELGECVANNGEITV